MDTMIASLGSLGAAAFQWSAVAFLLVNGTAAAIVLTRRDRSVVNRLTSPLIAANLLLLGTGLGLPALAFAMRLVVQAVVAISGGPPTLPPIE